MSNENNKEDEGDSTLDYQALATSLKDRGNELFRAGDAQGAVALFTQGLDIDPDNHILYSNRSAAHLLAGNKSKALYDAEKCVALAPTWTKGYSRLGAAQQALKRFEQAIDTLKKGIALEPENQSLWTSLRSCEEAYSNDKKQRFAAAALEREREEELQRQRDEAFAAAKSAPPAAINEDDLLSSFFSEVKETSPAASAAKQDIKKEDDDLQDFFAAISGGGDKPPATDTSQPKPEESSKERDETQLTAKYIQQDLGDAASQLGRLIANNYKWKNLNPYVVFQLDIDATEEDIKYRYKKLSAKVHPDKLRNFENAREAFEEVKNAYAKLMDPDQKKVIVANIELVKADYMKERRKLVAKGLKESDLPPLEEELSKKTMQHFAEIEMSRKRSEANLRTYSARDKIAEDDMKKQLEIERDFEKEWSEENRRDKRVGNWRDFQTVPEAKKSKLTSYKEEKEIKDPKKVVIEKETWKKKWK